MAIDIKTLDLTGLDIDEAFSRVRGVIRRNDAPYPRGLEAEVREILRQVQEKGDEALIEYARRFDAPDFSIDDLVVTEDEIQDALSSCDRAFIETIKRAKENIWEFHKRQLEKSWFITKEEGIFLGQMLRPVGSCGLYCPGGQGGSTPLVSTVLMNAIPAKIADVERVVMATPPSRDRGINPYLICAAHIADVDVIYKMGSAWAIGALAYGTDTVLPVDVIVGPGNIFVALAKKLVSGIVGIDMIAGPSEVLIIADKEANPDLIASDLLAQAEHDPMALCILTTTHPPLLNEVRNSLNEAIAALPRREIASSSLNKNGLMVVTDSLETAVRLSNMIAPEHLELMTQSPFSLLPLVKNAGAIFMGEYTPESIGDYIAGPNHVLPTMGTARFSSALGVDTFLKKTSIISYSKDALLREKDHIVRLAQIEGLDAHAMAVVKREEILKKQGITQ